MKSSTLRRSTLSKENMEVIETLAKEQENNGSVGEYIRPDDIENQKEEVNKAQEIDLLWQNFKATQFNSNSPTMYIIIGFIIGVAVTLIAVFGINAYTKKTVNVKPVISTELQTNIDESIEQNTQEEQNIEEKETAVSRGEASETTAQKDEKIEDTKTAINPAKMKKYVVKNGDTGESIIKHFYGAYTPERADAIIKANNLKTLDRINIDQELLIPVE